MSLSKVLHDLNESNTAENELFVQAKEGANQIFDGLITQNCQQKLQIDYLQERVKSLEKDAVRSQPSVSSHNVNEIRELLQSIATLCCDGRELHECKYPTMAQMEAARVKRAERQNEDYGGFRREDDLLVLYDSLVAGPHWKIRDAVREMWESQREDNKAWKRRTDSKVETKRVNDYHQAIEFVYGELGRLEKIHLTADKIANLPGSRMHV